MRARSTAAALLGLTLSLFVVPPAHADEVPAPTGTVRVTVKDSAGGAPTGMLLAMAVDGSSSATIPLIDGVATDAEVPPGQYALAAMTPWAGLTCAGFSPCTFAALQTDSLASLSMTGVLSVSAGSTATAALTVPLPTLTSASKLPGATLKVKMPAGYSEMITAMAASSGASGDFPPAVQWLRNGRATGRTSLSYPTRPSDAGATFTAKLTYNAQAMGPWTSLGLSTLAPVTTPGITLKRGTARLALGLPRTVKAGRRPTVRVRLTTPAGALSAWVRVRIGTRTVRVAVINGRGSFRLPALARGSYRVKATWAGSLVWKPATRRAVLKVR